ncbi:MAG TPA: nickel-dependent hydrogenase large subunit [Bryobacteraceae bacterium]|nr:nickel-dependent hydrogenase large subunit [Bryobacteraceae bacterium]
MARLVVDPVNRIEGHLRIEAQVDGGKISDAWSSGTMFRGIELILQGRDPREAWIWAQRICGVCTMVHAIASVRAVENALNIDVPRNAQIVRDLIAGSQMVQDHVIHFYHLHALDWVDVAAALKADPAKTSTIAQSISDAEKSSARYFKGVQDRVKAVVDSGQLSLFASGYWGHPAYTLPPEINLLGVAHYLEALAWQKEFIRMHATLGGKNPHPQTFLVGGMSTAMDPNEPAAVINPTNVVFLRTLVAGARKFVEQYYIPDVLAIAPLYKDWFGRGEGLGNFLSYGDYSSGDYKDASTFLFPRGIVTARDISKVLPVDQTKITESVSHSWYDSPPNGLHPSKGETKPKYSGPKAPFTQLDVEAKYSWLKAPRYDGMPMEVGPLARMIVGYAAGQKDIKAAVDGALKALNAPPTVLFSTLGRIAARALETQIMVGHLEKLVDELDANLAHGNTTIFNPVRWDPDSWPATASGYGWHEAPRGALGHWVEIENKGIKNYQAVVPSTWNAGPRDEKGQKGAYEASLLNTPVADPNRPLEILRTIHSFDPCLACAVHTIDAQGREYSIQVPAAS